MDIKDIPSLIKTRLVLMAEIEQKMSAHLKMIDKLKERMRSVLTEPLVIYREDEFDFISTLIQYTYTSFKIRYSEQSYFKNAKIVKESFTALAKAWDNTVKISFDTSEPHRIEITMSIAEQKKA